MEKEKKNMGARLKEKYHSEIKQGLLKELGLKNGDEVTVSVSA